jgi:hypothetical protein
MFQQNSMKVFSNKENSKRFACSTICLIPFINILFFQTIDSSLLLLYRQTIISHDIIFHLFWFQQQEQSAFIIYI